MDEKQIRDLEALAAEKVAGWMWEEIPDDPHNAYGIIRVFRHPTQEIYGRGVQKSDDDIVEWDSLPRYLRSVDAALTLAREGWIFTVDETISGVTVQILEGISAPVFHQQFIEWERYPDKKTVWATAITLCALKAVGVDVAEWVP